MVKFDIYASGVLVSNSIYFSRVNRASTTDASQRNLFPFQVLY
nr:MAG TPA: hypothetical protein [Caudoviricetes sp.]